MRDINKLLYKFKVDDHDKVGLKHIHLRSGQIQFAFFYFMKRIFQKGRPLVVELVRLIQ